MKGRRGEVVTIAIVVMAILGILGLAGGVTGAVISSSGATPPPVTVPGGPFVYNGIPMGSIDSADYDGDYISDRIEYWELHTDPTSIYTNGNPIDDFNAVYTYGLDPLDSNEVAEFMDSIPNVEARQWPQDNQVVSPGNFSAFVEIAKRDPLNQWYAKRTTVEWEDSNHTKGLLFTNNEPFFLKYEDTEGFVHSAYYLTHGRVGTCGEVAFAHHVILELMGYDCLSLSGFVGDAAHGWVQVIIDGQDYVVDYNELVLASTFYQTHGWIIIE